MAVFTSAVCVSAGSRAVAAERLLDHMFLWWRSGLLPVYRILPSEEEGG